MKYNIDFPKIAVAPTATKQEIMAAIETTYGNFGFDRYVVTDTTGKVRAIATSVDMHINTFSLYAPINNAAGTPDPKLRCLIGNAANPQVAVQEIVIGGNHEMFILVNFIS